MLRNEEQNVFGSVTWVTDPQEKISNGQFVAAGGDCIKWQAPEGTTSQVVPFLKEVELKAELFSFLHFLCNIQDLTVRIREYENPEVAQKATEGWRYSGEYAAENGSYMRFCTYSASKGEPIVAVAYAVAK